MIIKGQKEISARYLGNKVISAVYYGTKLVWEAISSCFGRGYWDNNKPWSNNDGWNNG
jgi:nitric oxide synthase oxygenase domain/subunit